MKLANINNTGRKFGQAWYVVVAKPVVVAMETVWKIPCVIAVA